MNKIESLPDGNIRISVNYVFAKRSGRKRIILEEDAGKPENLDMIVIRALARAKYWADRLDKGNYSSVREIAEVVGTDKSYVAKLIRLSNLSPFIVRQFLNGTAPDGLSLVKLIEQPLPDIWEEQHKLFGIKI